MGEHAGHRKRIMERLDSGELLDHELLEILLFNAVPRRNTNDLAHRLLSEFGTVNDVLNAEYKQLCAVEGIGESIAAYLCALGKINRLYLERKKQKVENGMDMDAFTAFVKEKYAKEEAEVIDAYFLGEQGNIIGDYRLAVGSLRGAKFAPEKLAKCLTVYQPAGTIIVHNHPAGNAQYSQEDELMTRKVQVICSAQNVLFCDHIICGVDGVYSYYLSGRMTEITKDYSMYNLVRKEGV